MKLKNLTGATPLDEEILQGLIPNLTTQEELNQFEAKNIADAMLWTLQSRTLKKDLLSATGLYTLHRKMFDQTWKWAGKTRWKETNIGVAPEKIQDELGVLLVDIKYWKKNQTYNAHEIAARFHHKLVWIHLFPNGNGRFARLACDLLLEFNGNERFNWGPDDLVKNGPAREKYLMALKHADQTADISPLLIFAKSC